MSYAPTVPWYLNRNGSATRSVYADCFQTTPVSTAAAVAASLNKTLEEKSWVASLAVTGCNGDSNANDVPWRLIETDPEYPFVIKTIELMVAITRFRPSLLARCRDGSVVLVAEKTAQSAAKEVDLFQV